MGCYVSKCKKCGNEIIGRNHFVLGFNEKTHEEENHKDIFEKNKAAEIKFKNDYKKINDEKIQNSENIFTGSKWDGDNSE